MSQRIATSDERFSLRQHAQQRLKAGLAPPTRGWGVSVESLTLLHRLASAPDSAADALQLLHELQVHQVELDLQQAQLEASEDELTEALARYRVLFERAPVAYFVLDAQAHVEECNRAGVELLGLRSDDICGRPFGSFLSDAGRMQLTTLLAALRNADLEETACSVQPDSTTGTTRDWKLAASAVPASNLILLAVTADPASPDR